MTLPALLLIVSPPRRQRGWTIPLVLAVIAGLIANLELLASALPGVARLTEGWLSYLDHVAIPLAGNLAAAIFLVWAVALLIQREPRQIEMARRLERRGDLTGAGELYLQAGDLRRAMTLFRKGRAWLPAARAARENGMEREAAYFLRRAGGEHLEEAAQAYRHCGDAVGARQCAHELAEWYTQSGRYLEAVTAWSRAGESLRSARAARLALDRGRLKPVHPAFNVARAAAEKTRDYELMAQLHELEGNWIAAAKSWRTAGNHARSAENFRRGGNLAEAAASDEAAGRPQEALRARLQQLDHLGERLALVDSHGTARSEEGERLMRQIETIGAQIIPSLEQSGMRQEQIRVLQLLGRIEEAVKLLSEAGDTAVAAELARDHQRWDIAGPLLEQLRRWGEASDVYEHAEKLSKAALCAERAGEDERAFGIYLRQGATEDAARCLGRMGRLQDGLQLLHKAGMIPAACELLKSFPGPIPDIPDVILDMAGWLKTERSLEEAIACLQRAVLGVAIQPGRLDPAVALARYLLEAGDLSAAEAQVARVLEHDYSYEPARNLRLTIEAARRGPAATQAAAGGDGSSPALAASAEKRYEIADEIGQGGMGVVYKARDKRLERDVAIKVLRTTSAEEAARLEEEAKASATLNHPGIVTVYDFEAGFGGYFIVMEYVPGDALDKLLKTDPTRVSSHLLHVLIHLADAVSYAHEHRVVHRDLKPGNILLTPLDEVKILDFGIAARLDSNLDSTVGICGTPFYMAPEQIRGEVPTPASDIYSFGATAFHLATGRPPFPTGNILDAHLNQPPPHPMDLRPDLDEEIAGIILCCLEKEPDQRFRSVRDLHKALTMLGPSG
jgi:tRNA A-37 threonylcarbamoyl transferase component Bud32